MKHWEIIADNLSKAGWCWGCVSAVDSNRRKIWIADAHRDDGKRSVVRADEKLTVFVELESISRMYSFRSKTLLFLTTGYAFSAGPMGIGGKGLQGNSKTAKSPGAK